MSVLNIGGLTDAIKLNTLKIHIYENVWEMKTDLDSFLVDYNLARSHSSLRTELGVKTLFEALEYWFEINPQLFKYDLVEFKQKLINMKKNL